MASTVQSRFPDGIADVHATGDRGLGRHANPVSILVLGALFAAALLGVFGGGKARPLTLLTPQAELTVTTPRVLRNGEFFETRITVTAASDIADLVVAVPAEMWRDMTINTMIPAPSEEKFAGDSFRFSYGALRKGDVLTMKIDGQINPPLFAGTRGEVSILDGDRPIGGIPFRIDVLP